MGKQLGQSLGSVSRTNKSKYYRSAAAELVKLSEAVKDPAMKGHYIQVAAGWHDLACELERHFDVREEAADAETATPETKAQG